MKATGGTVFKRHISALEPPWRYIISPPFTTSFGGRIEREANDFACAMLMDVEEALEARLTESWEIAEHFGIPDRMVRLQLPLLLE